jgi:hypothetical protein
MGLQHLCNDHGIVVSFYAASICHATTVWWEDLASIRLHCPGMNQILLVSVFRQRMLQSGPVHPWISWQDLTWQKEVFGSSIFLISRCVFIQSKASFSRHVWDLQKEALINKNITTWTHLCPRPFCLLATIMFSSLWLRFYLIKISREPPPVKKNQ